MERAIKLDDLLDAIRDVIEENFKYEPYLQYSPKLHSIIFNGKPDCDPTLEKSLDSLKIRPGSGKARFMAYLTTTKRTYDKIDAKHAEYAFYKRLKADRCKIPPWLLEENDPVIIYKVNFGLSGQWIVYLNPTDCRGYRCIVRYQNYTWPHKMLNNEHDADARQGLHKMMALIEKAYLKIFPHVQSAILGNNAHAGKEPSYLHGHVWGRGGKHDPPLGEEMSLKGPKIPWESREAMEKVCNEIKKQM